MSEKLHPESMQWIGRYCVAPDRVNPIGAGLNLWFEIINSPKRAIAVSNELDGVNAWGVMTPEQAQEAALRLKIDPKTRNFTDPKQSKFSKRVQRALGLID